LADNVADRGNVKSIFDRAGSPRATAKRKTILTLFPLVKRPLAAALVSIVASVAIAQTAAPAFEPFVIRDIRVEGAQRTEPGTIFSYLPVKVGERIDADIASAAIKSLFATGFFRDVRIESIGDTLVISVVERPTVSSIIITGAKEFDSDTLKKSLRENNLAEGRIFDRSILDKAEQEIKKQYVSRGRYGLEVTTTVTPQERNRVAINIAVVEGEVSKIQTINIVGTKAFREKDLIDEMQISTPGWFTWYTKTDQYSRTKLQGDLEALRSYYTNRGYLEFNVESTQVSVSPDRDDVFITINVSEGPQYTVSDVRLSGDLVLSEAELRRNISLNKGDIFNRQRLSESAKRMSDRLGVEGYAYASVNAIPEIDKEKRTVTFTYYVDPGRRVYVRRINVVGNNRSRDEIIRRELRQLESSWYNFSHVQRSKSRIQRLDFFSEVNIETLPVAGQQDLVDLEVQVKEKSTGDIRAGIGYSSGDGLQLQGSVAQNNAFGSGNSLALQVNSSKVNRVYSLSWTNPYFTADGVSLGYDIYRRNYDATSTSIGSYKSATTGGGLRFGVPISETDTVNFGLRTERTEIGLLASSPARYIDYVNTFGRKTDSVVGTFGWARDTRDDISYPSRGWLASISGEIGVPGTDLKYYRTNAQGQYFQPLGWGGLVLGINAEVGYGNGYGGKPLPFFKNYYAGGVGSVRGFEANSLGPRVTNILTGGNEYLGGSQKFILNTEILFPLPGSKQDKSIRGSLFVDMGLVRDKGEVTEFETLRLSAGAALAWTSPVGPLKFSLGYPLRKKEGDKIQRFQFQVGTSF
jgi:outer membrane protein insertion porin family